MKENDFPSSDLSALFLAVVEGRVKDTPSIISESLLRGGGIRNGVITPPSVPAKLFTQHAHAENIRQVFDTLQNKIGPLLESGLIIEVGSGDGYLKYLLSLLNNPLADYFTKRLIETESSLKRAESNRAKGKMVIHAGISDLPSLFGESFTPCVVSMNVVDTFSYSDLKYYLKIIHRILKGNGMFVHIMSSSVHPSVFTDIKDNFPDSVYFPYHEERHIGVRILPKKDLARQVAILAQQVPKDLCDLFALKPEQFMHLADTTTEGLKGSPNAGTTLLFEDYSLEKIKRGLVDTGFRVVGCQPISSSVFVDRQPHHGLIPDANRFNNLVGALLVDSDLTSEHGPDTRKVQESATFWTVMGQAI